MQILRIVGWDSTYENNRTRSLRELSWVPIPNQMDGDGYTELLNHPNGPAHYAAWMAIILVASKCTPRGNLLRDNGQPHDSESLSRISRIEKAIFDAAIPRLVAVGWLTASKQRVRKTMKTEIQLPHLPAEDTGGAWQEGAPSRAREKERKKEGKGREASEGNERLARFPNPKPKNGTPGETLVREALAGLGLRPKPDDPLPGELICQLASRGIHPELTALWVAEAGESKKRAGDPIRSCGFFRETIGDAEAKVREIISNRLRSTGSIPDHWQVVEQAPGLVRFKDCVVGHGEK